MLLNTSGLTTGPDTVELHVLSINSGHHASRSGMLVLVGDQESPVRRAEWAKHTLDRAHLHPDRLG